MAARRSRSASASRTTGSADPLLTRLTTALETMAGQNQPNRPKAFKPPQFNGTGDVEYFIGQFVEVAVANEWSDGASLLHLRETLKEGAQDCGRASQVEDVFTALRARYGLTPREARSRLNGLRRESKTTVHEHAAEIERLIEIAYSGLPGATRVEMAVDMFCSTIGNPYLQRHLLAVPTPTIQEAVKASNEYLQIRPGNTTGGAVRPVGDPEESRVAPVAPTQMETLLQTIQQLTKKVDALQNETKRPNKPKGGQSERPEGCWGCKSPDHIRKDCPVNPWPAKTAKPRPVEKTTSGNENGPQQ